MKRAAHRHPPRLARGGGAPPAPADEAANLRLLDIVANTPDLVAMCTPSGQVLYVNRAGLRLLGHPDGTDLSRRTIREFHPPEIADFVLHQAVPEAIRDSTWNWRDRSCWRRTAARFPSRRCSSRTRIPTAPSAISRPSCATLLHVSNACMRPPCARATSGSNSWPRHQRHDLGLEPRDQRPVVEPRLRDQLRPPPRRCAARHHLVDSQHIHPDDVARGKNLNLPRDRTRP